MAATRPSITPETLSAQRFRVRLVGFTAVFWLAAMFAIFAIISTPLIPKNAINDRVACGFSDDTPGDHKPTGIRTLLEYKPLLVQART